jgi:glucose-1-phosphate cytidylyltransferase
MQAIILAGGLGTRISEESHLRPKPMIELGGRPILWHIMKIYSTHGINEFIICCGYKGYVIKEYFSNYFLHHSDVTINLANNQIEFHRESAEPWKITLVDTGVDSMTGGRIRRIKDYVRGTFCLTYGDGVSDINISELIRFHKEQGRFATLTSVQPEGRFGAIDIVDGEVKQFVEKPKGDGMWVNGGFFVCEKDVFDYIDSDSTVWEQEPLSTLAIDGQLSAYKHRGFWQPMDTLRDKIYLEKLLADGKAQWKTW